VFQDSNNVDVDHVKYL